MKSQPPCAKKHRHDFVETYSGPVAFGWDRRTDEACVRYYLQKFSDDALMDHLLEKLPDSELSRIFNLISELLQNHLSEAEYHRLFLKEAED